MLVLLAALAASPSMNVPSDVATVRRQEDHWASALERQDARELASLYDEDAWLVLPGAEPIVGTSAIERALSDFAQHATHMRMEVTSVRPLGRGFMVENSVAHYDVRGAQTPGAVSTVNYQVIWKREPGGSWRILRDVVSPR